MMKTLSAFVSIVALSLLSVPAWAQQNASPSQPGSPRSDAAYVVEVSSLSAADSARPEWSQQLAVVTNSRATARYSASDATVVDLSVAVRPATDADRVVIELELREERGGRASRSSQQTRQSIVIRRGETQLVQSRSPDGTTRLLRISAR
jgi:hypothetical protein